MFGSASAEWTNSFCSQTQGQVAVFSDSEASLAKRVADLWSAMGNFCPALVGSFGNLHIPLMKEAGGIISFI